MRHVSRILALALAVGLTAGGARLATEARQAPAATADAEHHVFLPGELQWQDGPESLPPGARFVVLEGDPAREGEYFAFRVMLPDGYRIPPHWHPVTERVTVLSGTFHLGTGERFHRGRTRALPAGSFFSMPAEMRHFAFSEGETILQLNSIGPFDIHYVNPADDPRQDTNDR